MLRDCNKCGDVVLADPQMEWDAVRCKFCRQGGKMRVGGGGSGCRGGGGGGNHA